MTVSLQTRAGKIRCPDQESDAVTGLFASLGWRSHVRDLGRLGEREHAVELVAGGETQVLLLLSNTPAPSRAVSLAYSREAHYASNWTPDEISVTQASSWDSRPGDTTILDAPTEASGRLLQVLELMNRDDVLDRAMDRPAVAGKSHPALAEKLASELARLRVEIAAAGVLSGDSPERHDLAVLHLFHQLLYLRIAEDRGSFQGERLRMLADEEDPVAATADLLTRSAARLNSELFAASHVPIDCLTAESLRMLLIAMTEPWESLRLDFSVARTELASRLYESYLSLMPAVEESGGNLQIFPTVHQADRRSAQASYYTPSALAEVIVDRVLTKWADMANPKTFGDVKVLDPACGSGTFLCASFSWLCRYFEEVFKRKLSSAERGELLTTSIFGTDLDERSLGLAQVQLLELADLDGPLPPMAGNLLHGDALLAPPGVDAIPGSVPWEQFIERNGHPTCIVTNPPFISEIARRRKLGSERVAELDEHYGDVRSKGADHAYTFISLAVKLLLPGGSFGAVLPRQVLAGESGAKARHLLLALGVNWLVDLRTAPIFADVDVGICALAGLKPRGPEAWQVELQSAPDFETDPRRIVDALTEQDGGTLYTHSYSSSALRRRQADGWAPLDLRRRTLGARALQRAAGSLGERAQVTQGVKPAGPMRLSTGEFEHQNGEGTLCVSGIDVPVKYAPLLVAGSDLAPFSASISGERVLLPFEDDHRRTDDPGVTQLVSMRGGLPKNYRVGNLEILRNPKVLVRTVVYEPVAYADINGSLIPKVRGAHALGFSGADDQELLAFTALLNSAVYQWLLRNAGTPRQGDFVELIDQDLESLPWPDIADEQIRQLSALASKAIEALGVAELFSRAARFRAIRRDLDALCNELLGVSKKTQELIRAELRRVA